MARRQIQIAVIGGNVCSDAVRELAERVGVALARRGATLVCGGLGGVMEAVASGAHRADGRTVGVLPTYDHRAGNPWIDVVIPTGFGYGRNVIVVASGHAVIALPGECGTASEIALALTLKRPVIALGAWHDCAGVVHAHTPEEAVDLALKAVGPLVV
jgi:uncharacterized protein (TIGR00725 family)